VKTRGSFFFKAPTNLWKPRKKSCKSQGGGGKKNFSWNQSTCFRLPRPQKVTNRTLPQICKQKESHTPWQEEIRENQGFFFLQSAYKLVKAQEKVMQEPGGRGKKTSHEISPHLLRYLDLKKWQTELCHKHANRKRHTHLDKKRFVENLASFPSTLQWQICSSQTGIWKLPLLVR
jgi:hypothetical protein